MTLENLTTNYYPSTIKHADKETTDGNKQNHQLRDIVLMWYQVLRTDITKMNGDR